MKDRFDERTAAHARNRSDTFEIIQQPSHENHEISRQELAAIREGSDTTHFHHNRDDSCEIDQELRLRPESRMRLRMLRIDDAKNVLSWFTHTRLYIESTFVDLHLRGSNRMIHGNNLIYGERNTEVRVSGCNFSTTVSLVSSLRLRYNKDFRRKDTCGQEDVYYENVSSRMMLYSMNSSSGCQK